MKDQYCLRTILPRCRYNPSLQPFFEQQQPWYLRGPTTKLFLFGLQTPWQFHPPAVIVARRKRRASQGLAFEPLRSRCWLRSARFWRSSDRKSSQGVRLDQTVLRQKNRNRRTYDGQAVTQERYRHKGRILAECRQVHPIDAVMRQAGYRALGRMVASSKQHNGSFRQKAKRKTLGIQVFPLLAL